MPMTKKILCALLVCATGAPFDAYAIDVNTAANPGFQFGLGAGGSQLHVSEPGASGSVV